MSNNTFNTIYHKGQKWNSLINVNVTGLKVSTLWEGSKTSSGQITLNEDMNNYDYLRFYAGTPKGSNGSTTIPVRLFKNGYASLINRNWWGAPHDEYINFNYVDATHINVGIATTYNLSAFLVEGIKLGSQEATGLQIRKETFTGKIDPNGYLINVGGVSSAKVHLPKNATVLGWKISKINNLSSGTGFQLINFQYYTPNATDSMWCFRILNWDDAKLGEKTGVEAEVIYKIE